MSHEIVSVADPAMLYAQLAGCGSLLGAGFKLIGDEGEEDGAEGEGAGEEREVDIFRDTPVRYLGYANECGEAFRPLVPGIVVTLSYAVAIAYVRHGGMGQLFETFRLLLAGLVATLSYAVAFAVSADAIAKGYSCAKESSAACKAQGKANMCAFPATLDVLLFQMLASVIFPGFTINRWVTFVGFLESSLNLQDTLPPVVYEYLPTAAGLALIPFIVKPLDVLVEKPLDVLVEKMLDVTVRPLLVQLFPLCDLEPIFGAEPLP
ncbi:mitochondrial 18 KDa protein-domain-containing protein [Tribonema minus]|uniref:Mitochondrial fission process protein 1 n=1 Tax=Tribonema minus TaxID=303371 RepID=A0A835Z9H3_9STRA|nr:mitochondrial 18 KDa protein-domain-containing protein [Tribonema minus]